MVENLHMRCWACLGGIWFPRLHKDKKALISRAVAAVGSEESSS